MISNPDYQIKVKEIYEEEKENGIEGYESFKIRCVEQAQKLKKRTTRQKKKNKLNLLK